MSDFFTADQIEILSQSVVRMDFLATFDFTSGTARAWNGNTVLDVDGETYQPMYGAGTIDGLALTDGTVSDMVSMSLNGLPGLPLEFLAAALTDTPLIDQQTTTVAIQLFTDDWQVSGVPIPIFVGAMQPPKVARNPMNAEDGGGQIVNIDAENIFFNRSRPSFGRCTDRDQQARSDGDTFFGFVSAAVSTVVKYPDY